MSVDVVVVGGGIAGLAALARLSERGVHAVLLEREPWLAGHASGRNAAIFRPLEDDASTATLARRSEQWLREELGVSPVSACGLMLVAADHFALDELYARALHAGPDLVCERLSGSALVARAPALEGGQACAGLWLPSGGVLDAHAVLTGLEKHARARGAELRTSTGVAELLTRAGRIRGVRLDDGSALECGAVVLAAGAWNATLARPHGSRVQLQPIRRHLVQLETAVLSKDHPVVWRIGDANDEVYFRPESGGVLASPCDEQLAEPGVPEADARACEELAMKLGRTAPMLVSARVRRSWACLRTFALDRELVIGPDPALPGLHWLGGLGGRGMGVAVAAAEELVNGLLGTPSALVELFSPARG